MHPPPVLLQPCHPPLRPLPPSIPARLQQQPGSMRRQVLRLPVSHLSAPPQRNAVIRRVSPVGAIRLGTAGSAISGVAGRSSTHFSPASRPSLGGPRGEPAPIGRSKSERSQGHRHHSQDSGVQVVLRFRRISTSAHRASVRAVPSLWATCRFCRIDSAPSKHTAYAYHDMFRVAGSIEECEVLAGNPLD